MVKEVTAITGEYTNAQGGAKKRYQKIGVILDTKHGPMLKLELIPLGWTGMAFINDPKPDGHKPKQADPFDDSAPF